MLFAMIQPIPKSFFWIENFQEQKSETSKRIKLILNNDPKIGTIVPNMSSGNRTDRLTSTLFGKTRRALLAIFYTHPEESFYLRQVIRAVSLGQGTVQRELAKLTGAGLLLRNSRGNQVFYQANRESPIFKELQSLVVKTAGVADVLRTVLSRFHERIRVAFIYGSVAAGTFKTRSDVDVMIVGNVTFAEVTESLRPTQDILGREVNPSVYSPVEFQKKLSAGHHFLKSIVKEPKVFLIGDERELAGLGKKRSTDRA
jgi:predicted nucleotidyltransferase